MARPMLPMPEPPVSAQLKKKKEKANKKNALGSALGGIAGGILGSGLSFGLSDSAGDSMAEALEKQAANMKRQAEAKQAAAGGGVGSPYELLQQQLFDAVNSINVAPTPIEELRALAESQVGAQFDPQITGLQNEITTRSKRAGRNQQTARDMYGSLAKDFLAELPAMTAQFAAEDQAANQRYDQAQQQMQGEYDEQAAEQAAVLKRLGIQAASQDASQQAMEDQAYFQNQSEMDQQAALSALNEQQMAQTNYQQNMGSNARMAGENTAQDIGQQLEDFLSQANSQLTGLRSQKASAIEALLAQMQQQDAQAVAQQRQQEFENQMKLYNFQLSAQKAMGDGGVAGGTGFGADGTLTTGLEGAQNYLASQYPDQPLMATGLMEQLNDVLSNKAVTQGKFVLEPGNEALGKSPKYSDVGQEYMMDLLRREFEKEGDRYSSGDINATMNALLAYLGKLR